jgi:hypothetical protein
MLGKLILTIVFYVLVMGAFGAGQAVTYNAASKSSSSLEVMPYALSYAVPSFALLLIAVPLGVLQASSSK